MNVKSINLVFMKNQLILLLCILFSAVGNAQNFNVSGTVSEQSGNPIPGVNITWKGTTQGVVTDFNGKFDIKSTPESTVLQVSFIGFVTQEFDVEKGTVLNITLEEALQGLDEVVVVGYGTQNKASVVAAISTISAAEIVSTPTSNIITGLAGKMPGLSVMIKDGELGSENIQTLIRGQATMNNSSPLVLVDGVERTLYDIDPYDVETVNVLKDASATAVFGVRGANGVILVTTKKGKEGKAKVTANLNYSVQNTTRQIEPMNAIDYMNTRNQVVAMENDRIGGSSSLPYNEQIFERYANKVLPEYYVDRNFQEEFVRKNVPMLKGNVNISGGNEVTKYFASVGYLKQGGPFKTERWEEYNYDNEERLDRFTYRANIDMNITSTLKAWLNLSGSLQDKNDPMIYLNNTDSHYDLLMAKLIDIPSITHPDLTPDGQVVGPAGNAVRTPYGMLNRTGYRITTKNSINTTLGFVQQLDVITQGLSVKAKISYDSDVSHLRGFGRSYSTYVQTLVETPDGPEVKYSLNDDTDTNLSTILSQGMTERTSIELSTNYKRKFNKKHDVTGLFLFMRDNRVVNGAVPYNYVGVVGRATYGFMNKYLAEFNFGMNGSEQFAKGKRFGFFPSFSAGWVLSEEKFLKDIDAISFLKLRGSFGQVGNDKMTNDRFLYVPNWKQGYGGWLRGLKGIPGLPTAVYQDLMHNPGISWEVANKYNVGLESQLFRGFEFDLDVFYEKRNSILLTESFIPELMLGQADLPPTNTGVMTNRGFETKLGYTKKFNKDFRLGANFSMAFARNNVENWNEQPFDDSYATPYRRQGYSLGSQFGYDFIGYFKSQEEIDNSPSQQSLGNVVAPGDLKYRDANEDGVIDYKDYVEMDYPSVPELNYSFSLFGNYKGFDFNVLLTAVDHYSYNILGRGIEDWGGNDIGGNKNYFNHHANAWTPERAETGDFWYPRMYPSGESVSKQPSNFWIIDTWYARIKNLELGYTLPKAMLHKIGISNIRLFITGSNLAIWDNLPVKTIDPETRNSLSHPIYSTYNFGLNVSF